MWYHVPNITPKILRYDLDPFLDTFWRRGEKKGEEKREGEGGKKNSPLGVAARCRRPPGRGRAPRRVQLLLKEVAPHSTGPWQCLLAMARSSAVRPPLIEALKYKNEIAHGGG